MKVGLKLNIQKTEIMASGPTTSWEIDGEIMETVSDFIFLGSKIIDVFLELSCFSHDPEDVGKLISGSSAFSKTSLNIWKFSVHVLLKPGLENFANSGRLSGQASALPTQEPSHPAACIKKAQLNFFENDCMAKRKHYKKKLSQKKTSPLSCKIR